MLDRKKKLSSLFLLKCRVVYVSRNGCATSEDLFWKLEALQAFIRDLHWPNPEFGNHLEQRLKLMACDMIESCIQRTEGGFQSWSKKGVTFVSTDYIIPTEMCAMINVILDAKNQSFKLCAVDGIDVVCQISEKKHPFEKPFEKNNWVIWESVNWHVSASVPHQNRRFN